jgi:Dehydrogenases with different specificities (related to short-chain alcohol dehydrogenases)
MNARLAGRTAFITAAGQGIGHATALAMAREGASVIATDVNPALLAPMQGIANVTTRTLDVLDDEAVSRTLRELPPLSILFNCAGYVHNGTILDCKPEDWAFSFNLNVRAMYVAIRAALPAMLAHHEASGPGEDPQPGFHRWVDQGIAQPVRVRRVEGRRDRPHEIGGCRLRAARHPLQRDRARYRRHAVARAAHRCVSRSAEARRMFVARQPMGRLARPEEIAPLVVFLASDEAAFITGNVYSCDGGMTI